MNYSRQREIILETLKKNVVHPTAEYLYGILQEKAPNISLATLYRNLNQLAENGIIKKIDGLEAPSHFDHNTHEHFHVKEFLMFLLTSLLTLFRGLKMKQVST